MWLMIGKLHPPLCHKINSYLVSSFLQCPHFGSSYWKYSFKKCVFTLVHVFSCAFGKIFKKTFFTKNIRATAYGICTKRFVILICNKSAAEAWLCLVSFSWLSLPHVFFLFKLKLKWLKNVGTKDFVKCIFHALPQSNQFLH